MLSLVYISSLHIEVHPSLQVLLSVDQSVDTRAPSKLHVTRAPSWKCATLVTLGRTEALDHAFQKTAEASLVLPSRLPRVTKLGASEDYC
jgi:hypothetical protein